MSPVTRTGFLWQAAFGLHFYGRALWRYLLSRRKPAADTCRFDALPAWQNRTARRFFLCRRERPSGFAP